MAISSLVVKPPSRARFNFRAEFRRLLLAAAEICWVSAVALTLSAALGFPRSISPFSLLVAYWLALEIGHYLPRLRRAWPVLQASNAVLAALLILLLIRLDLYRGFSPFDFSWLGLYVHDLIGSGEHLTTQQIATAALLYVYVRGVGFGQRPLTLWFVGFQFRLGVLVLFLAALFAVFARGVNLVALVGIFFVVSLLGIALARIEEGGREMALGARWAATLAGGIFITVVLGLFLTPLFTLAAAQTLFDLLSPLAPVFEFVLMVILTPLFWIITTLFNLLTPLIGTLGQVLDRLHITFSPETLDAVKRLALTLPDLSFLLPYLRLFALLALVFGVALLVARALNRRIMQVEAETFIREAAGAPESTRLENLHRPRAAAPFPREIEAENIRRLYAALLARAAAVGLPRREAETPFEFLPRLTAEFPNALSDLRALTEAYVAVHYAQQQATPGQVHEMRVVWQRLRKELVKRT